MKHNSIKSVLVTVAGLALCAPLALQAQTTAPATTAATPAAPSTKVNKIEYRGTVKSVDTAANTITVTTKKGDLTFAVATTTKIAQNKKTATLADITLGEKVSGSYTKDATGALTAASIHGKSAPAAAAKPAVAAAPAAAAAATTTAP